MSRKLKTITDGFILHEQDFIFDYQGELTPKLDALEGDFDQNIINEIVLWKVNRYAGFSSSTLGLLNEIQKNSTELDEELTQKVLKALLDTKGVRLPMASAILRFKNSLVYQIIDQRVYRLLYGETLHLPLSKDPDHIRQIQMYIDYLKYLREVCQTLNINFREADRILYNGDRRVNSNFKIKT